MKQKSESTEYKRAAAKAGLVAARLQRHGFLSAEPFPSANPLSYGVWVSYADAERLALMLGDLFASDSSKTAAARTAEQRPRRSRKASL